MSDTAPDGSGNRDNMNSPGAAKNARIKREMTYHYAGKVHVRGLLRRVWRPRYLALGDDGYLRYHESIPPLFQQDLQRRQLHNPYSMSMSQSSHETYSLHNSHRPKSILAILDGARTIDPYSVVDRHVALPQGVYGFVFRGRPVELYTSDSSGNHKSAAALGGNDAEQGALILPPGEQSSNEAFSPGSQHSSKHSKKAAVVNLVFPKGTERRRAAQKIAKKAINPDVLCGFGRINNACEGGPILSRSSSSSSLMGYEQDLIEEESGNGHHEGEEKWNHEWGLDSHESHGTMGSYQRVESSQVCGDLSDDAPSHRPQQRERMQNPTHGKSTVQVQVQAASIQSREYLCAVSTAEEAESWVVALRWAAEHRRRIKYEHSPPRRNEAFQSASAASDRMTVSAINSSRVATTEFTAEEWERSQKGGESISDSSQNREGVQSKRNSDSSDTSESDKCITKQGFGGDSKASLTSLLIEQEGWCKAMEGSNKEPLFAPESSENDAPCDDRDANVQTMPRDEPTPTEQPESPPSHSFPTIVVTKVYGFRQPQSISLSWAEKRRHSESDVPWLPFRVALPGSDLLLHYEIQLLLLKHCKRTETLVKPESLEERTVYKTIPDVLALVRDLTMEFGGEEHDRLGSGSEEGDCDTPQRKGRTMQTPQSDDTVHLLEDVESKLLHCLGSIEKNGLSAKKPISSTKGSINEITSCMAEALASVGIVDDVMRKLSKDGNICSSDHFQEFLHLHATHHQTSTHVKKTAQSVPGETDAEQVVKEWLARVEPLSNTSKAQLLFAIALRHQLCGPILLLIVTWSSARLASTMWSIMAGSSIIVSVPFETYVSLIALAFFFGNYNGASIQHGRYDIGRRSLMGQRVSQESMAEPEKTMPEVDDDHSTVAEEGSESGDEMFIPESSALSSPLPLFPANRGISCWSKPDHTIFMVRSSTYLEDRVKLPSSPAVFQCRGVDVWITDNAERNISRHPSVLGGELGKEDTFVVNFLLPFSNFVAYFTIPPIEEMPANVANVWTKFINGDQQYRDGKLKLLPVVVDGPWIVKKAVGPGTAPAMIGRDLPLQYYFSEPTATKKGVYEVDVLVTASRIARGILNVVKGHTKSLTIAFAFIIEASEEAQLPETVLCAFQVHSLHLEDCPNLPDCYPDG